MKTSLLLLLAPLAACATTYEARVERELLDAGLPAPVASCMAERLVDRLSASQLRSLGRLKELRGQDIGAMRVDELLRRAQALVDPEIYAVLTTTGIGCAIAS